MDGLSAILEQIKLKSVIYFKSDFGPDWGMDVPQGPFAQFHIIAEGNCCFMCNGGSKKSSGGRHLNFPQWYCTLACTLSKVKEDSR